MCQAIVREKVRSCYILKAIRQRLKHSMVTSVDAILENVSKWNYPGYGNEEITGRACAAGKPLCKCLIQLLTDQVDLRRSHANDVSAINSAAWGPT